MDLHYLVMADESNSWVQQLTTSYPDLVGDEKGCQFSLTDGVTVWVEPSSSGWELVLWDEKGTDYALRITEAREEVSRMDTTPESELTTLLITLRENITGVVAGFDGESKDDGMVPYDHTIDPLIEKLRKEASPERELKVYTYGTRYVFVDPEGVQARFDACHLRGERNSELAKLRGTDPKLQQVVRVIPEFPDFLKGIVRQVETENLHTISIFCRGGHHRSVTAAELLRPLYPKVIIDHMNIDIGRKK